MRLADHGSTVLASARDASKLAELGESNDLVGHIIALPLDVTTMTGFAMHTNAFSPTGYDLCVLNAGTYIPTDGPFSPPTLRERH